MRGVLETKLREVTADLERADARATDATRRAAELEGLLQTKNEELTEVK